jgi:hypothetical protein
VSPSSSTSSAKSCWAALLLHAPGDLPEEGRRAVALLLLQAGLLPLLVRVDFGVLTIARNAPRRLRLLLSGRFFYGLGAFPGLPGHPLVRITG